jgi:hypothetical protein
MRALAAILVCLTFMESPLVSAAQAASLTATDVRAWLNGLMPNALYEPDIARAVILVVKDDEPLLRSPRRWFTKMWSVLLAASLFVVLWVALALHLILLRSCTGDLHT